MLQALERGYDVVGIDISKTAVEKARERIVSRGFDALLITGDILDPDIDIGRFDCILLHHVLDNMLLDGREKMVKRAKELLSERGIISFQDLSRNDVRFGNGEEVEKNTFLKGDGIRLHFFDLDETRDLFRDLEIIELGDHEWAQGRGSSKLKKSRIRGIFQLSSFSTRGSTSGA
jgi:SAM-dependent methyltransferase